MDPARIAMTTALCLFLLEGFTLAVFPVQFKEYLEQADPRTLQAAGFVETLLAVGLMAAMIMG
jgi:uncharacterized protein YjeT (DUF2065 family)